MKFAELLSLLWGGGAVWFSVYQVCTDRFYYRSFWGTTSGWLARSQAPVRFRIATTIQFFFGLFVIWAALSHNVGFKGIFLRELFTTPFF